MPMMKPLVVWVTRQAELARQPVSASRSKAMVRYGLPPCGGGTIFGDDADRLPTVVIASETKQSNPVQRAPNWIASSLRSSQ
jgi:hypothetical protein